MSNFLRNGTVLPSGLLNHDKSRIMEGFKKTFQNKALKAGIVVASYAVTDPKNISKLFVEYDVLAFEQNENKGSTVSTYKNCPFATSLGNIADFFEMTLRPLENQTTKGTVPSPSGQDGTIVLLLCLNGLSDTAIILGCLQHPDRPTTIVGTAPYLQGEYNGVNVVINNDGSTTLTFKGATKNDGTPVDSTQGNTAIGIAKDGSYTVGHSTITQEFNKNGKATLTTTDDITNTTKTNYNVTATKDIVLNATGDLNTQSNNIAMAAQGSATIGGQSITLKSQSSLGIQASQISLNAQSMVTIASPNTSIQGQVALGAAGGQPVLLLSTMLVGIGNLGAPVISYAVSGYSTMVTAI